MERDEFVDPRDVELEPERELHAAPYRDWGWPGFDDPRLTGHGIVEELVPERDLDPADLPKGLEERAHKRRCVAFQDSGALT